MLTIKTLLEQRQSDTIAVLNGRMTPVTTGHEENVRGLHKLAKDHDADHIVLATHSHDIKTKGAENKNPLSPAEKEKHLKRAFPGTNIHMTSKDKPSIFHHLSDLHSQGYKHLVLTSGEDRVEDYERIKQYNGKEGKHGYYNFKSIKTASTGERKPGISGTDMRKHAEAGNYEKFKSGLASNLRKNDKHAKDIFNDVRHGMGLSESTTYNKNHGHVQISKFEWGTPEGTKEMKRITPGENSTRESSFTPLRQKIKEQKIPVLLMTVAQRRELHEQASQLEFDGIQTKHLDMCPSAYIEFKSMIADIRAGKHIGEMTGHTPAVVPFKAATPEISTPATRHVSQAANGVTPTTDALKKTTAGIAMKPTHIRKMQFKDYLEL